MTEQRVQRRLAAILAADVVGYSRLMGADEAGTLAALKAHRAELIDPAVAEHGGRIVKLMGDGMLVEFASVVDAVDCAVAIQRGMAGRNAGVADDERIAFRIGVNLGDVIIDGDDIYGDGVNIAARLEGLAAPGGVCVSGMVHAGVRNKLSLAFEDLGVQSLKNIDEPVHAFGITLSVDSVTTGAATDARFRRPAIAVLPFDNMSGDAEQEYFADGLTEEIITALCRWRRFPVIARNSTFTYKGRSSNIQTVGRELGARYVVEGSVRRAGDRVRVTAQLIDAETGHHLWAERYDRALDDVFAVQDEIAQQIAAIIEPTIDHGERLRIAASSAKAIDAWDCALRGFACIYEGGVEANDRAFDLFRRAIDLDPNFARAHSGLAYCFIRDIRYFCTLDRADAIRQADEHARRAVQLDESDAEAHAMLARTHHIRGRHDLAVTAARRAVELNPFDPFANNVNGAMMGVASADYEAAIPWFEKALKLNPLDPQQYLYLTQQAFAELGAERYEDAVTHARDAAHRNPDFLEAWIAVTAALGHLGRDTDTEHDVDGFGARAPDYVRNHVFYCQDLKERLLDGLRKAGIPT